MGFPPSHSSQQDPLDNHSERQHQALSQEASIPPGPPGHALRVTIFLLSVPRFACLDMVPLRNAASPQVVTAQNLDPSRHRFNPAAAPQPLGLTGPASPRLRSLARSTMGFVVRPDQSPTTAPDCPTGSPAHCSESAAAPESLGLRLGCAILAARWHPHLMIVLIVHSVSSFPSPTTGSERLRIPLSRLGLGKSLF